VPCVYVTHRPTAAAANCRTQGYISQAGCLSRCLYAARVRATRQPDTVRVCVRVSRVVRPSLITDKDSFRVLPKQIDRQRHVQTTAVHTIRPPRRVGCPHHATPGYMPAGLLVGLSMRYPGHPWRQDCSFQLDFRLTGLHYCRSGVIECCLYKLLTDVRLPNVRAKRSLAVGHQRTGRVGLAAEEHRRIYCQTATVASSDSQ
jgi:hypothetical protein